MKEQFQSNPSSIHNYISQSIHTNNTHKCIEHRQQSPYSSCSSLIGHIHMQPSPPLPIQSHTGTPTPSYEHVPTFKTIEYAIQTTYSLQTQTHNHPHKHPHCKSHPQYKNSNPTIHSHAIQITLHPIHKWQSSSSTIYT